MLAGSESDLQRMMDRLNEYGVSELQHENKY